MPTLTDILTSQLDQLSNQDAAWVTFITDHKYYVQATGRVLQIEDDQRSRYYLKLNHFLRDNNVPFTICWITKLINECNDLEDFTTRSSLIIPSLSVITNLYRKYVTTTSSVVR